MQVEWFFTTRGAPLEPSEVIKRLRSNMLIHSYLYYWCDDPIWTDDQWQQCANRLAEMQEAYPEPIGFYDEAFVDWSGDTGAHLPKDDWVREKATYVTRLFKGVRSSARS